MHVSARSATSADRQTLVRLYRELEAEMAPLSDMWARTDGLTEPVEVAFDAALADDRTLTYIGEIDGVPCGFCLVTVDDTLPQSGGVQIGSFRLIFVDHDAREVGVGEALRDRAMEELKARGLTRFDAHVLPGHRLVKNFFESGGFSARKIVMHHDLDRER